MKKMLSLTLGIALMTTAGTAYAATPGGFGASGPGGNSKPSISGNSNQGAVTRGTTYASNSELLTLLGLDKTTLAKELAAGKTLAEIAEAQGVTAQSVIDLLVSQETAKLDKQVTDGKLTQEKADQMKAALTERITAIVNGTNTGNSSNSRSPGVNGKTSNGPGGNQGTIPGNDSSSTVNTQTSTLATNTELQTLLGLDQAALEEALAAGKSLADIAAAQGVEKQAVIDLLVSQETAKLDQEVTDGKLTQTQADQRKANLTKRITALVEKSFTSSKSSSFGARDNTDGSQSGTLGEGWPSGSMEGRGGQGSGVSGISLSDAAEIIGLTETEIQEKLAAGSSLAEIAAAQGISEDDLITALLAKQKELITTLVEQKSTDTTAAQ